MSKTSFNTQELALYSNSFIVPKYISAPYTTIQNRAQVLDASNMLQAVMGVERIPCRSINLLQKEFGVNGEQVWELESKDARVRFVGSGWVAVQDINGGRIQSASLTDFIEISYYGTGLNLLANYFSSSMSAFITVDNGSEIAVNIFSAASTILSSRNYNPNQIISLIAGQTLGQHTVKIRNNNAASLPAYGIEVLNQSSSLTIPPGQAFIGNKKESLNALTTSAYNAGFTGTKGGRVSKYLLNGAISQVVRECPATPSYLTNANHADEEVVRRVNFREFGVNRVDDFSTLSTVRPAAFTLDDGTTTLVGDAVQTVSYVSPVQNATSNFYTFTFVGTGLDLVIAAIAQSGGSIYIDGVLVVGTGNTAWAANLSSIKICSGLPYGTHTVKIVREALPCFMSIQDFIIYQPKAPTLPVGAIQIADTNNTAISVVSSTVGVISTGAIRKMASREAIYVGTWVAIAGINIGYVCGLQIGTSTIGSYVEYSFYGTGVDFNTYFANAVLNFGFSIDGSSDLSAYTRQIISTNIGTVTLVAATGVLSGTPSAGAVFETRISLTGMTLGWHKIRVTQNATTHSLYADSFDIITPIHINHPTLKIGSMSLLDNKMIQALALPVSGPDLSKAKAWLYFDGVNNKILASYNISQVLSNGTGVSFIYLSKSFKNINYVITGSGTQYQMTTNNSAINYCRVVLSDSGGISTNAIFAIAIFGELIDE
jgi:hypothetical protein